MKLMVMLAVEFDGEVAKLEVEVLKSLDMELFQESAAELEVGPGKEVVAATEGD